MNETAVASNYAGGEYATAGLALILAIVIVHAVMDRETKRFGLAARQWPAWLAFGISFPTFLAIGTLVIR